MISEMRSKAGNRELGILVLGLSCRAACIGFGDVNFPVETELKPGARLESAETRQFDTLPAAHQAVDALGQFVQLRGGLRFADTFLLGESRRKFVCRHDSHRLARQPSSLLQSPLARFSRYPAFSIGYAESD